MSSTMRRSILLLGAFSVLPGAIFLYQKYPLVAGNPRQRLRSINVTTVNASLLIHSTSPRERIRSINESTESAKFSSATTQAQLTKSMTPKKPVSCFAEGTIPSAGNESCVCSRGWHGVDCSIPEALWRDADFQTFYLRGAIKRRLKPRVLVNGMVFNHELDMLDIRLNELGDAVDYYFILESNYSYFGNSKGLHLHSNLAAGPLRNHAHKIIPLFVGVYNTTGGNPWSPENHFRHSIWTEGTQRLQNLSDDDLFMITDADEIPYREVLLFLKHHDGYGEPIIFGLRSLTYGYFWEDKKPVIVCGVGTVGLMRHAYDNDSLLLRRMPKRARKPLPPNTGTFHKAWRMTGSSPRYVGWHCSWCFDAHGIQVKLASGQRDDGVRWGDIAVKTELAYIDSLRKSGSYFDNHTKLRRCDANEVAPAYVKKHTQRFAYLLAP